MINVKIITLLSTVLLGVILLDSGCGTSDNQSEEIKDANDVHPILITSECNVQNPHFGCSCNNDYIISCTGKTCNGTRTCNQSGELKTWSECIGQSGQVCGDTEDGYNSDANNLNDGNTKDGIKDSGATNDGIDVLVGETGDGILLKGETGDGFDAAKNLGETGDGCICHPGVIRWCDEDIKCAWGNQQCLPSGTWGTCTEVAVPKGCEPYDMYNSDCCTYLGFCCQNLQPVHPGLSDSASIGNCTGIICQ